MWWYLSAMCFDLDGTSGAAVSLMADALSCNITDGLVCG